jgi:hypothetical protein
VAFGHLLSVTRAVPKGKPLPAILADEGRRAKDKRKEEDNCFFKGLKAVWTPGMAV